MKDVAFTVVCVEDVLPGDLIAGMWLDSLKRDFINIWASQSTDDSIRTQIKNNPDFNAPRGVSLVIAREVLQRGDFTQRLYFMGPGSSHINVEKMKSKYKVLRLAP